MPTAVIAATVSGSLDQADRRAMLFVVQQENARRAAQTPPIDPLPFADNVQIRTSYAVVQSALLNLAHLSYVEQSDVATLQEIRARWPNATDQQRAASLAALPPN
jgi:hypothetical protein